MPYSKSETAGVCKADPPGVTSYCFAMPHPTGSKGFSSRSASTTRFITTPRARGSHSKAGREVTRPQAKDALNAPRSSNAYVIVSLIQTTCDCLRNVATLRRLPVTLIVIDVKDYASVFEHTQNNASVREGAAI